MMERKFTDDEIVKALEMCNYTADCDNCPCVGECWNVNKYAIDLINRQKADIELLIGLVSQNEGVLPQYEALIKREAVTEFAEMVKAKINDHLLKSSTTWNSYRFNAYEAKIYGEIIDNLVKEMTESDVE